MYVLCHTFERNLFSAKEEGQTCNGILYQINSFFFYRTDGGEKQPFLCVRVYSPIPSMHNFNISSAFGSNDLELQFLSRFNSLANHFFSKSFMTGCVRAGANP